MGVDLYRRKPNGRESVLAAMVQTSAVSVGIRPGDLLHQSASGWGVRNQKVSAPMIVHTKTAEKIIASPEASISSRAALHPSCCIHGHFPHLSIVNP